MKHIYNAILFSTMTLLPASAAYAVDPETLDWPEETWKITYDAYQSLWNDDPAYKDLTHTVTIKRNSRIIYIKGLFEKYPDAWVEGGNYSKTIRLNSNQRLSPEDETPEYFQGGNTKFISHSNNDREYTVGAYMEITANQVWLFGDDGADRDILTPRFDYSSIWIGSTPGESWAIQRVYHFDTSVTGSDFGPMPIYRHPTFRRVSESGIESIETEQARDTRVFDLSGRQVNPDRLTPGIYIRAGRKFIVR